MSPGGHHRPMSVELRKPEERTCEDCGRRERWDEDAGTWRATETGSVYCLHEWDINGSFLPFEEVDADGGAGAGAA